MKKILLVLLIFVSFSAVNLSAWEPSDLTEFPPCMNADDWILNLGLGIHPDWINSIGDDYYVLPKFRLSFDKNFGVGNKKLPFFFGGLVGYSGNGYIHDKYRWHHHRIPLGFRAGYHFNWDAKNLDTYINSTVGYNIGFTSNKDYKYEINFWDDFFSGINLGARWFISKGFGFWLEAGFNPIFFVHPGDVFGLDVGFSFKF